MFFIIYILVNIADVIFETGMQYLRVGKTYLKIGY
jgi:hypothetical protein